VFALLKTRNQLFLKARNQLIGLVHAPADPRRLLAPMERGLQLGAVLDDPPVDRGVIDMHTTFEHEFLNMARAQGDTPRTSGRP